MRGFQYLQQLKVRAAICMDADTQHDPQDIPKFIEAMNEYPNPNHIIIGARTHDAENAAKMRHCANQVADFSSRGQQASESLILNPVIASTPSNFYKIVFHDPALDVLLLKARC